MRTYVRLEHAKVIEAFRFALDELYSLSVRPIRIAERAHEIYGVLVGKERQVSHYSFQRLVYGGRADSVVKAMLDGAGIYKRDRIRRSRMLQCFRKALEMAPSAGKMNISRIAHALYIEGLGKNEWPSEKTFRHLISGKSSDRSVRKIIQKFRKKNLATPKRGHKI